MALENVSWVEFTGGPFDGHVQSVRLPLTSLAKVVALPVSREILEMLTGQTPVSRAPATSEALYSLEYVGSRPRYRFMKTVAPAGSQSSS